MFLGGRFSMPHCSGQTGTITPPELMSYLFLTGGDSGDRASCVGSRAGILPWGQSHCLHPYNLLQDSGLSPHLRVETPQKGPCLVPQTFQGACALALAMGSIPWPLIELFL